MKAALNPTIGNGHRARRIPAGIDAVVLAPADERPGDLVFAECEIQRVIVAVLIGVAVAWEIEQRAVTDLHGAAVKLSNGLAPLHHTTIQRELGGFAVECLPGVVDKKAVRESSLGPFAEEKCGLLVSVRAGNIVGHKPPRVAAAAGDKSPTRFG